MSGTERVALDSLSTIELLERTEEIALRDPSGDSEQRWNHVVALHRRTDVAIFERAAAWCGSEQPLLRALGADVLGQLGCLDSHPFAAASTPILLARLADAEPAVLASALLGLAHLGTGDLQPILSLAAHRSGHVRYAVAYCLGARDEPEARAALVTLSADEDPKVRDWATFGLGSLSEVDSSEIRAALAARLHDDDLDARAEAIIGLARRGDERAILAIQRELDRDEVGSLVIDAATELPRRSFLPGLEALLEMNPEDAQILVAIERCRAAR